MKYDSIASNVFEISDNLLKGTNGLGASLAKQSRNSSHNSEAVSDGDD